MAPPASGSFIWYELMTNDSAASTAFYRNVVGWHAKDAGMPGMPYTYLSVGEVPIGGVMELTAAMRDAGAQPCWMGYIGVDDVDAYAARLAAAGGKVLRPPGDIPGVGRFSVVADPHGAVFVLFKGTSEQAPPRLAPGTQGGIGWNELHAGDGPKATEFYTGLFGWTKGTAMDMGAMGVYQIFAIGGVDSGGIMTRPPETPGPFWLYYFNVDVLDAATARATGAGAKVINGPMEVPGPMWIVQCLDPQGVMFALVAPKR